MLVNLSDLGKNKMYEDTAFIVMLSSTRKFSENCMMMAGRLYKVGDQSGIVVGLTRNQAWTYAEKQDKGR